MEEKNGFTLIELLSVILILGIIALIVLPVIATTIMESRQESFELSIGNIINAVEQKCQIEQMQGQFITKYYRFEDGESIEDINISGKMPDAGSIIVDEHCNINVALNQDNFIAIKDFSTSIITIIEREYYKPGTSVTYDPGDGTYTNWYVLKDRGNIVTLILDRNLSTPPDGLSAWSTSSDYIDDGGTLEDFNNNQTNRGPITALKNLYSLTSGWNTVTRQSVRLLTLEDTLEVLGVNNWNDNILYFDTKSNDIPVVESTSKYAWLFNNLDNCENYGCETLDESYSNYWMSSSKSDEINQVYLIDYSGSIIIGSNQDIETSTQLFSGIRPVITIAKDLLL